MPTKAQEEELFISFFNFVRVFLVRPTFHCAFLSCHFFWKLRAPPSDTK